MYQMMVSIHLIYVQGVIMPRGKQSGIAYGQKKQNGQSDTEQLIQIASYLRKKYKVKVKREPYLVFDINTDMLIKGPVDNISQSDLRIELEEIGEGLVDFKVIAYPKNPDLLWIDKYGMWIIEVDGAVHDRKTEKTRKRNELFISNHIKLIVVNLADLKEMKKNIYDYIDEQILERIRE